MQVWFQYAYFNYDLHDQNSYLFCLVVMCFANFQYSKWIRPKNKNPGLKLCNWDSTVKISVIV